MHHTFKKKFIGRAIAFVIVFAAVLTTLVFLLWNWLMPAVFKLPEISFLQAFGILLLSKILFLGFHKRPGSSHDFRTREFWKKRFEEEHKAAGESPEAGKI